MSSNPDTAARGRNRFSISTRFMQDYGIEAPVSGATQLVTAKGRRGRLEVFSIGTDQRIHHFFAGSAGEWSRLRLPWKASSLAVVPQHDGTDKVFFAELAADGEKKTVTLYELENAGREPQRRLLGRFATTDPKVYGVSELSGVECRHGSNVLVTALAARPGSAPSSWVVLFGHRSSTGALSLGEGKGVVARKVLVAGDDPGSTAWPHLTFVLVHDGAMRVEWGKRGGVLLQSERLPVPELPGAVEFDVTRDRRGHLAVVALDRDHRIHVLCQIGGGGAEPPRFTKAWLPVDVARPDGTRPAFRRVRALRHGEDGLLLLALDADDRLWSAAYGSDGWGPLEDAGVEAAHVAAAATDEGVEVFAVSRQNQLLWLRKRGGQEGWRLDRIGWDAAGSEKIKLDVYRTGLTIFDEGDDAVAGVPVRVTATEKMPSTVNGLSYAIGPGEPVVTETNAFGRICVTFELDGRDGRDSVPALRFESAGLENRLALPQEVSEQS